MDKITITRHLTRDNVEYVVTVDVLADGCHVALSTGGQVMIPWADIEDVARLSDIFEDLQVFLFKFLINVLAQAFNLKNVC